MALLAVCRAVRAHRLSPPLGSEGLLGQAGRGDDHRQRADRGWDAAAADAGGQLVRQPDPDPRLRHPRDGAAGAAGRAARLPHLSASAATATRRSGRCRPRGRQARGADLAGAGRPQRRRDGAGVRGDRPGGDRPARRALESPADPASSYVARPEWYAIPLYQLRMYFEGPLEIVATMILPGIATGLAFALPFLDRGRSHRPGARKPVMLGAALALAVMARWARSGSAKDARDPASSRPAPPRRRARDDARRLALKGMPPEGGMAVFRNDPLNHAREIWDERCGGCHGLAGAGGDKGPTSRATTRAPGSAASSRTPTGLSTWGRPRSRTA